MDGTYQYTYHFAMPIAGSSPRVSIFVEWENAINAGEERAQKMLRALSHQSSDVCHGVDPCIQLISLFDSRVLDQEHLRALTEECLGHNVHITREYVPAEGADYYQMKNIGVRRASAPLVLYLDSDVIPEPGWLRSLIGVFDVDPDVGVAASAVYLESGSLVSATLALIWFAHLRPSNASITQIKELWVNSTVFRKEVAISHPLIAIPGSSRTSCSHLTQELLKSGVKMVRHNGALVEHPAVAGKDLFVRAIARGRDAVVGRKKTWWRKYAHEIRWKGEYLLVHHRRVGISKRMLPLSVLVAATWWAFNLVGAIATKIAPRYMSRHFLL